MNDDLNRLNAIVNTAAAPVYEKPTFEHNEAVEKAYMLMKKVDEVTNNITKAVEGSIVNSINNAVNQIAGVVTSQHVDLSNSLSQLSGWISSAFASNQYMYPTTVPYDPYSSSVTSTDVCNYGNNVGAGCASTSNQQTTLKKIHRPPCVFCKSIDHFSRDCCIVKSISSRLSIVSRSGRCFHCFRVPTGNHSTPCQPSRCHRGCFNEHGTLERHSDWYCPRNPDLEP